MRKREQTGIRRIEESGEKKEGLSCVGSDGVEADVRGGWEVGLFLNTGWLLPPGVFRMGKG